MVSDEKIITALLEYPTAKKAADAIGINPQTVYNRMNKPEFVDLLQRKRIEALEDAKNILQKSATGAALALNEIIENPDTPPAVKVQAAQTILRSVPTIAEELTNQKKKNTFTPFFM